MLYNLRSDIIYYKSSSDFELEFNLCGCCRMRLLTDKPSNKKAFVHSLARAVSRSRVILIVGMLFGEDNTIKTVSQALGTTTEIVDNKAYGIASDEEIEIIKSSLPLVSKDGSFGGCIIESGPQIMILLTDNKALRKDIMTSLVHPYITELYAAELNNDKDDTATTEEEAEIYLPEQKEVDPEPKAVPSDEQLEQAAELYMPEEDEEDIPLILSDEHTTPIKDITEEDIFFDTPETIAEAYAPEDDITIDDLFPSTPGLEEAARTIEEKIDDANIILDNDKYLKDELPEAYHKTYKNLYTENEPVDKTPIIDERAINAFHFVDDDGEVIEEPIIEKRRSGLHITAIIFTVILLLAIVALCYSIFTASASEAMSPTEYIREVWQTIFK